jgi:hypothetical protein
MRFLLISFLSLLLASAHASGQAPAEGGWISLFNGKDLSSWKINGTEKWVVDDETILGESTTGKYGYLTTDQTFADFMLRLRFKCETNGNSGVFLRSRITGESPATGPDIEGMQVEVDPTRHTGGLYESGGRGWVALPTADGERAIKPGDWNYLEIAAEGRHYVTRLNGVQIVDWSDPAPRFTRGVIGLQLHTGGGVKIRFKDIYLMELSKYKE